MSRFLLHGVIVNKATSLPSSSDVTCGSKPWKGQDRKGRAGHRVETRSFPEPRFQTGQPNFLMLAQREQGVLTRRGGMATRAGGGARTRGKQGGRQDPGPQGLRVGLGLPPAEHSPAHVEHLACSGAVIGWCVEKEPVWRQL